MIDFSSLTTDLERVLITEDALMARVRELGEQIAHDYEGKRPFVICILKGAVVFFSDLIRAMPCALSFDFIATSSYGSNAYTSGVVRILKDLDRPIEGEHVLLVEDIVDSGLTLSYLVNMLSARKPASIRIAALLDKPTRRKTPLIPDYTGFEIDDLFVVGYGLDYAQKYRNLPMIGVLSPMCYM